MSCQTTLIKKLPCFHPLHTAASSNSNRLSMAHLFQLLKLPQVLTSTWGRNTMNCLVQLHHKCVVVEDSGFGVLVQHLLKVKIGVMCLIGSLMKKSREMLNTHLLLILGSWFGIFSTDLACYICSCPIASDRKTITHSFLLLLIVLLLL